MEVVREFLLSSTVHGLAHIAETKQLSRLFWLATVLVGFSSAGFLIQQSFANWAASPVTTTLESFPLSQLSFPRLTVCPPKESHTSLNLLINRIETNSTEVDNGHKNRFRKVLPSIIFDTLFEEKYSAFIRAANFSLGWYRGDTAINFSDKRSSLDMTVTSAALTGEISSPFLGEALDDFTMKDMEFTIKILVPTTRKPDTKIVMKVEVDVMNRKGWHDRMQVGWDGEGREECLEMCGLTPSSLTLTQLLDTQTYFYVNYSRTVKSEDGDWWTDRHNTGFSLLALLRQHSPPH